MTIRRYVGTLLAACLVGAAALAVGAQDATATMDPNMPPPPGGPMGNAMAPIMDASGAQIGWASFSDAMGMPGGQMPGAGGDMTAMPPPPAGTPGMSPMGGKILVTVQLQSTALTPGFHGMHLHTIGNCGDTGEGPFTAAGPHLALQSMQHPEHSGDAPAILVNADGTGYVSFATDRFTMADLLDADGSAIIIHALPDNYANIPSRYGTPDAETLDAGDSGPRVACGAVQAGTAGMPGMNPGGAAPTMDPAMMPTTDPAMMPTTDPAMMPTATAG